MEQKKKGFKLSKVNWIFAASVAGISALIFLKRNGVNGFSLGYLFGSIVTSAIILVFLTFIVWLIKGKKEFAGTYVFNSVLVLMCLGMIREIGTISKERTDSVDMITKSASEYKNKINNEDNAVAAYKEHSENVDEGLTKLIRNSIGEEQEVYKNLQKFTAINSSIMMNWQKSFDSVALPRILDYSVLNNQEEFKYQIGVLKHYKNQSELYRNHFEKRLSMLQDLNKNIPNDNPTLKGMITGIHKKDSIQQPIFEPFIKSHLAYSAKLIELIEFLQINQGNWEYNNEELTFTSNELEEKYLTLINNIAEVENQINVLSQNLIEVM